MGKGFTIYFSEREMELLVALSQVENKCRSAIVREALEAAAKRKGVKTNEKPATGNG